MQKIATMTSRLLPDNIHPDDDEIDDDELLCSAGEHIEVSGRLEWLVPADKVRSVDSSGSVSGYVQSVGTAKWHDDDDDMRVRVLVTRTTDWKTFLLYESTCIRQGRRRVRGAEREREGVGGAVGGFQ
jgi:hypothetical protein